jgi:two-component system chemotaxis response regulator CheB
MPPTEPLPSAAAPPCQPAGSSFPVVALVCSLGGADALVRVLGPLPAGFPAAVVALQHLDPRHASMLAPRLAAASALTVRAAADGAQLEPGIVDVAPPGRHLLLARGDRLLTVASLERPAPRPSADLLLVSMAAVLGARLIAVVLTGTGDDGAVGTQVVARYGGHCLVQDEESCRAYGMPSASAAAGSVRRPVPLTDLAGVVTAMVNEMSRSGPDARRQENRPSTGEFRRRLR